METETTPEHFFFRVFHVLVDVTFTEFLTRGAADVLTPLSLNEKMACFLRLDLFADHHWSFVVQVCFDESNRNHLSVSFYVFFHNFLSVLVTKR